MDFGGILNQIFQPYFYYSVLFLVISFVCIKVLERFCHFIGQRTKSLLYLIPLAIPLIVMLVFLPSTTFQTTAWEVKTVTTESLIGVSKFLTSYSDGRILVTPLEVTTTSITGIFCIVGLAAGAFFALLMILANDRIARKMLHVILLSPDEQPWLQAMVAESSRKLAIPLPKIGFVEDLRPNAFTIGYGRKATVVFSIGLFNILEKDEIAVVASHELAHLKHHDFFFKTVSSALTVISFFNPLAYLAASTARRQREMVADERAIALLDKPSSLGNALAKICSAIQAFPKENLLTRSSASLLVTSSVLHRPGILSTHPRLHKRLRNISEPKSSRRLNRKNAFLTFLLCLMLVSSAIAVSYAMVGLQSGFITAETKGPSTLDVDKQRELIGNGAEHTAYSVSGPSLQQKIVVPTCSPEDSRCNFSRMDTGTSFEAPEPRTGRFVVVAPPISAVRFIINASDTP